jgi:creatinine amidohydrolase
VPSGSFSKSADASPEKGRRYHEYMVQNLVRFIGWLKEYQGPIGAG